VNEVLEMLESVVHLDDDHDVIGLQRSEGLDISGTNVMIFEKCFRQTWRIIGGYPSKFTKFTWVKMIIVTLVFKKNGKIFAKIGKNRLSTTLIIVRTYTKAQSDYTN
jgi:hypothetical protein